MDETVNTRAYRSPLREERARRTRRAILDAARSLFVENGYTATTVAAVAAGADVAVDTVYAAVGAKPQLFRLLWETAISGTDDVVPADERDYVRQIQAATSATDKLSLYASAVAEIQQRMGPLNIVLRDAAGSSPELRAIRDEISARRAANMRRFADELIGTGGTRAELTAQEIADIIWATSSADMYHLLVGERSWTPDRFELWMRDSWLRTLVG